MIVGRLDEASSRWYVDPLDPDSRYESVTTILSRAESLPWLAAWAAKLAAEYVAANLDELLTLHASEGPGAVVGIVKEQARIRRELKADIGTHQHDVLEALLLDAPMPDIPEHLIGVEIEGERVDHDAISDGLLAFITDFDVTPVLAEATVASDLYGYAGTLDLVAQMGRPPLPHLRRLLIDCKTGVLKHHARAQLAAYRRADVVWLDQLGNRAAMPAVDGAAILHLRREYAAGYKLVPGFTTPEQEESAFTWFLAAQTVLRHQEAQEKIPRGAWYPPLPDGTQPLPLLEDVERANFRARSLLIAAGITSVEDLTHLSGADLRALRGVGAGAVAVVAEVMAGFGLSLLPDPPTTPKPRAARRAPATTGGTP